MKNRRVHFIFDERCLEDTEKFKEQGRISPTLTKSLDILMRKPLPPKPTWTTILPTESGYYWMRFSGPGGEPAIMRVDIIERVGMPVWTCWTYGNEACLFVHEILEDCEWWPIPLTPPEE